jgi:hypothetical protein
LAVKYGIYANSTAHSIGYSNTRTAHNCLSSNFAHCRAYGVSANSTIEGWDDMFVAFQETNLISHGLTVPERLL